VNNADPELLAWRDNAGHWIAACDQIELMTQPASDALIERLAVAPGQHLLDVASGTGDPALRLARLVGPSGHVTATDGVPSMLEALRSRAAEQGLRNVTTVLSAAEDIALPPGSFDGASSRFGVMFFANATAALAAMHRAVRAGGRLAVAAWGVKERNPFFTLTAEALDEAGAPAPSLPPGSRTVFEFAEPDLLASVASAAGWHDVREERPTFSMRLHSVPPEDMLDTLAKLSRRVTERLGQLDPAAQRRAHALVEQRARPYSQGGDVVYPAEIVVVSARA